MPSQANILSFLTSPPKRKAEQAEQQTEKAEEVSQKKVKVDTKAVKETELVTDKNDNCAFEFASSTITIGSSWAEVLTGESKKPYFKKLSQFVSKERSQYTIYPPLQDVFSWTLHQRLDQVKVVILGQDPYHGPNQAHGLCFSVQKNIKFPPSLRNIFKLLSKEYDDFVTPKHGNLTPWAKQGVLLLNAVLTVRSGKANSHKDRGWEKFTDVIIRHVSSELRNVVFMLWGSYAQKKGANICKKSHLVLKSVHPSPLSAHHGYFECAHFTKANKYLVDMNREPVDWNCLSTGE